MNDPSRVCPKCSYIHDDVFVDQDGKIHRYQLCRRCLDEMDDNLDDNYDYASDDFNFDAARERRW